MNTIDQEELRKRFNPDGSLLRKQQLRMLDMLKYIDGVCKKHGIKYWLSSGTLLGAVRHGGFIPWDDDLDIEMLKGDYNILMRVLETEKNEDYALQTHKTDPNFLLPCAKLRDKHSCLKENLFLDSYYKYKGIFIDIFKLEPSSSRFLSLISAGLQYIFLLKAVALFRNQYIRKCYFNCAYFLLDKLVYPFLSFISGIAAKGQLRHAHGSLFLSPRNLEDIFPLKELSFEGIAFPVPHDYDKYLSKIYGNYMRMPDLNGMKIHLADISFYDD